MSSPRRADAPPNPQRNHAAPRAGMGAPGGHRLKSVAPPAGGGPTGGRGRGRPPPAAAAATVREVAERRGVTTDAVALAAVLAQPWRPRVLSGAVTVEQLRANLAAADVELSDDDLAALTASPEPAADYWRRRAERAWG